MLRMGSLLTFIRKVLLKIDSLVTCQYFGDIVITDQIIKIYEMLGLFILILLVQCFLIIFM